LVRPEWVIVAIPLWLIGLRIIFPTDSKPAPASMVRAKLPFLLKVPVSLLGDYLSIYAEPALRRVSPFATWLDDQRLNAVGTEKVAIPEIGA